MAEARVTGVEFDAFWDACVFDEVACFFRWFGCVRATVLVVFDEHGPTFIEVRQAHDVEVGRQVPDDPLDAGEEQPGDLTPGEGRQVGPQGVGYGEVAALVAQPHRVVGVQRDAQGR